MIRTILIDDEEDGRLVLQMALERYCPEVDLLAVCASPREGLAALAQFQPDLVFLDVQMPEMSGFKFLEQVGDINFEVIFVTAHDRYAIKAIKFSALDYLLKPVDVDELQQTLKRFPHTKRHPSQYQSVLTNAQTFQGKMEKIAIPTQEGLEFIQTKDIIFCQADGNYTTLYLQGQDHILVSKKLKEFEQLLSESGFCRVHHSSLINLHHVQKYVKGEGGYVILSEGHHADISRRKKEDFLRLIGSI